ncbi:MAG: MBL fold metallo-hydrolase [Syntrophobacteraceae bacterium]
MILEHLTVGVLQTNCYLLGDEKSGQAMLIDPGGEGERLSDRVRDRGLTLTAILNTHAHFDHILAAWTVKARMGGEIYLHPKDQANFLQVIFGLASRFAPEIRPVSPAQIDRKLAEGDELLLGDIRIAVIETPGHSPGHVSFYLKDQGMIFSGDTIFAGSIGRTDFPGGSREQLLASVRTKIFPLPDGTAIFPGHGPRTSVGSEKRNNPFFLHNRR